MSGLFLMLGIIVMCIKKWKEEKHIQNEAGYGKLFWCIFGMWLLFITEGLYIFDTISKALYIKSIVILGSFILAVLLDFRKLR